MKESQRRPICFFFFFSFILCRCACESERVLCEKSNVPMIAILFSSSVGMSIEWLTGVSQVVGSRPDVFSCELNFIKALVYTLCEDNLVLWLRYSFSDPILFGHLDVRRLVSRILGTRRRCGRMDIVSYVQGLAQPLVIIHYLYVSTASLS